MGIARPCSLPAGETTAPSELVARAGTSRARVASAEPGQDTASVAMRGQSGRGSAGAAAARASDGAIWTAGGRRTGLTPKYLTWLRTRRATSGTQRALQISTPKKTARCKNPEAQRAEQLAGAQCPAPGRFSVSPALSLGRDGRAKGTCRPPRVSGCCSALGTGTNCRHQLPLSAYAAIQQTSWVDSPDGDKLIFCR